MINYLCECGQSHYMTITNEEYDHITYLRKCLVYVCMSDCPTAIEQVQSGEYIKIFDDGEHMGQIHQENASKTIFQYFLDWCDKILIAN